MSRSIRGTTLPANQAMSERFVLSLKLLVLGLALITLILYLPAYWYDFIYLDDYEYVMANPHVQDGITWDGIKWAFTTFHASNWHPLTWLSHMLDYSLFGLNPGSYHLVNVLLHMGNSILVFLLWHKLTGKKWAAFFIGALFAWHPLRLESVVWIAERKDVLSTCLGLGALLSYVIYAQGRLAVKPAGMTSSRRYYWLALLLFALGLLAKPMLVTLPCVMLLLDYWPLAVGRFKPWLLLKEKWSFFSLSVIACVMTVLAQRQEAVVSLESLSLGARLSNVLVSYVRYLGQIFHPVELAIFYPMPSHYPFWQVLGAGLILAAITLVVWQGHRRRPWLVVGWCWYLGMLVPVIGLVQVGSQSGADRYTYWPSIGLIAAMILTVSECIVRFPRFKGVVFVIAGFVLVASVALTTLQLPYWRNAETLGTRSIEVAPENIVGHQIRGKYWYDQGKSAEALQEFQRAVQIGERHPIVAKASAHNDLGNLLAEMGQQQEALGQYQAAIKLAPRSVEPHNNLAITLADLGRFLEAMEAHAQAIELAPDSARPQYLMGKTYWRMGRAAEAIACFRRALAVSPQDYQSLTMLARILAATPEAALRKGEESVRLAQQAVNLTGQQQPLALDALAMAKAEQGDFAAAQQIMAQALALAPVQATNLLTELRSHAEMFQARQPWRYTNASPVEARP